MTICFRCDRTIQGAPRIFSPEVGSGVAGEITLCPGYCRSTQTQRTPDDADTTLAAVYSRPRPRRRSDR
ncbi:MULTISPECIES: hypothetical protein [unclassified Streptomyces]|uniref:hypothetical protein n=1 Tax=unclassified Streptomyces TaxID=2593676 RepID=UPI00380DD6AF